jgi:hypothetical protein
MKKTINTDIYNIVDLVNDVKKSYMPNEPDSALSVGLYGYIGAIEAKRLQTQIMMTSELANEPFPSRARLDRNVITHAIMANIEDINAIPAKMNAMISLKEKDIANFFNENNEFIIDKDIPIYLGEYEFHLEYDIIVKKIYLNNNSEKAATYTARYDISRTNPTSEVNNPFLSTPFVVNIDNQSYLNITVVVSQVMHNKVYKKLVTPNIVDNKTMTFEFDNQLAYFEVHAKELDSEYWITPIFEGSSVPNGVQYYCWYQYIDTNLIRIRFDRSSYMPGLNAEIEVLYKTTMGEDGNFSYNKQEFIDFQSKRYGYKGLVGMFSALTASKNGRNRKSKEELKALIPKELLSRGSYTTITDLNNYFGMFDSTYGRMIIQKKIDNQQERVYYSYAVLKDQSLNVIPSNTIDVKIDKKFLIKSSLNDSQAPRYILKSGSVIKMDDNNVGYITNEPLIETGTTVNTIPTEQGKKVSYKFKVKVVDKSFKILSVSSSLGNNDLSSGIIYLPDNNTDLSHRYDSKVSKPITDKLLVGPGQLLSLKFSFKETEESSSKRFRWKDKDWFTIENIILKENDKVVEVNKGDIVSGKNIGGDRQSGFEFRKVKPNVKCEVEILIRVTDKVKLENNLFEFNNNLSNINILNNFDGTNVVGFFNVSGFILTQESTTAATVSNGDLIDFKVEYKSRGGSDAPNITVKLSKGLEFARYHESLSYEDGETYNELELVTKNIEEENGFVYTNPFTVSINKHILYSAFYMMCVNENPFIHFEYINQASSVQFISTNILWYRNFLGIDKNKYHLEITLTQSTQDDLGLMPPTPNNDNKLPIVKAVAVFYRDGKPYRYKIMDMTSYDTGKYSYTFAASFNSIDTLDNDNNIRVEGAEVIGQKEDANTEHQYGYFNPSTELKIYALCAKPDNCGNYSRYDLDTICPGLDLTADGNRWTLTNIYSVVNGVTMYYNYSEIMGSKVIAYGDTKVDKDGLTVIDDDKDGGYIVKSVPVFGYEYCQNDIYIKNAIDTLNSRKIYIDHSLKLLENSFNIDLKFFNTYGKSNIYYVIKDSNTNNILDDTREVLDKVNLTLNFRLRLLAANDRYTKDSITKDIKEYIENLADIGDLHIPNLITKITNSYKERIVYFEYLGVNSFGPEVQHIYRLDDSEIPIDNPPEFLNINNIKNSFNKIIPDINIYLSEN